MSCQDPCYQDDCAPLNPCYDNCGCLNPTTGDCVTNLGTHTNIGVTNDMTLKEAFSALDVKAINPYNKVTATMRLAMTSVTIGTHVYQTDGQEGVWVYKSNGWNFAY